MLLVTSILAYFYFRGTWSNCTISVKSDKNAPYVKIADRDKWLDFIGKLAECQDGFYQAYSEKEHLFIPVRREGFAIVKDSQTVTLKDASGALYSRTIAIDRAKKQAVVYINIPASDLEKFKKYLHTAVFLNAYLLFRGNPYNTYEPALAPYKDLDALGISYEKP